MAKKLHICFISQEYPPETGWGGIGTYTQEIAQGLARAGHRVTVIARALNQEEVTSQDGIEVHRLLPKPDWNRWRGMWRLNGIWPGFSWVAARRLWQVHRCSPVDVVEAAEIRADTLFVSLWPRRPRLIVRLHTAWIFVDRMNQVFPDRKQRFVYWQEARVIRTADLVTAPSRAILDLTKTWVSLQRANVAVIPNPVSITAYNPAPALPRTEEILVVGRLEVNKGAAVLEQAIPMILRRRPSASFRIVGSDGIAPCGRSWRERLHGPLEDGQKQRVLFERTSRDELIQRYQRAALCLLPSLWENFPYAVLEAMSCGVPVVASRTGGLPELVDEGETGVLVPPSDPVALTETVCSLLEDPDRRRRMGQAARQRVEEHFSVESIVPRMLQVYRAVRDGGVP